MAERNIIVRTTLETGLRERLTPELNWRPEEDCDYKSNTYVRFSSYFHANITCVCLRDILDDYDAPRFNVDIETD